MDQRLSILHLCSLTKRNGTVHLASRLCHLLAGAGHRVVVGARRESKLREWTAGSGIEFLDGLALLHGFHPVPFARDAARIRRFVLDRGIDIVHTWQSAETWIAASALLGTPARLVRTRSIVKPMRGNSAKAWLNERTSALFVTCQRIEADVMGAGFRRERLHRLNEGVDTRRFRPDHDGAPLRAELGIGEGAVVVANIGRLEPTKGQVHFLRALARLPAHVHGVIAGEGRARGALEAERDRLGLAGRVHLLGKRSDIPAVLAASDVYALTSIGSEGSSRATLEALACGLPCVASDVGMLPDVIRPGVNGFLVPPGDDGALAAALGRLIEDRELRRSLAIQARRLVLAERSEERMGAGVEAVYRSVVQRAEATS